MQLERTLNQLQWNLLLQQISDFTRTKEGLQRIQSILPGKTKSEIQNNWEEVTPLLGHIQKGHRLPLSELEPIAASLKSAHLGQLLEGIELLNFKKLLDTVNQVSAHGRAHECETFNRRRSSWIPLPQVFSAIDRAVDGEGRIKDTASKELSDIRRQKRSLVQRIEDKLTQLMSFDETIQTYLQDNFITMRNERFVIPVRVDARGRIPGHIVDTSSSGQTLFIEPAVVGTMNVQLQDLDLSERLEILRVLKELTVLVLQKANILERNYQEMIELDVIWAQAMFAFEFDCNPVFLSSTPTLNLIRAKHPLLSLNKEKATEIVANTIEMKEGQRILIISGPNAGGKTVVLKTVGMIHAMVSAGLLAPCDSNSQVYVFKRVFLEIGDDQSLVQNLSSFSGHLFNLKPILETGNSEDLLLFDELASGTEPKTGTALAQSILEHLTARKCFCLVTTHYDSLKTLALELPVFRNASMEFSLSTYKPTYRLILDIPGQSYGLELAKLMGIPQTIISRAGELKGNDAVMMEHVLQKVQKVREEMEDLTRSLALEKNEAEKAKLRWETETKLFEDSKKQAIKKLLVVYEEKFADKLRDLDQFRENMKKTMKEKNLMSFNDNQVLTSEFNSLKDKTHDHMRQTKKEWAPEEEASLSFADFKTGDYVEIKSLQQKGFIVSLDGDKAMIQAGTLKLKVEVSNLIKVAQKNTVKAKSGLNFTQKKNQGSSSSEGKLSKTEMVFSNESNTIDLRGKNTDEALALTWRFIDRCLLANIHAIVIIHGYGGEMLKNAIRKALEYDAPYPLKFVSAPQELGGDGATVVYF